MKMIEMPMKQSLKSIWMMRNADDGDVDAGDDRGWILNYKMQHEMNKFRFFSDKIKKIDRKKTKLT